MSCKISRVTQLLLSKVDQNTRPQLILYPFDRRKTFHNKNINLLSEIDFGGFLVYSRSEIGLKIKSKWLHTWIRAWRFVYDIIRIGKRFLLCHIMEEYLGHHPKCMLPKFRTPYSTFVSNLRRVSPLKASQVEVALGAKFSTCRRPSHDIKQTTHVAYRMTFGINYRQSIVWDFARVMWFLPLQCGDFQSTLSGKTLLLRENDFSVVIFPFFPSRWTWKSLFLKRCKKKARPNEFLITLTRSSVRTAPRKSQTWHRSSSEIKIEIGNFSSKFMTCAVKCSWWI